MKKTIWKYQLQVSDFQEIEMPATAEILSLQVQDSIPCMWALVNPEAKMEIRTFATFGTGHDVPSSDELKLTYIATYQNEDFVFHVFETDIP